MPWFHVKKPLVPRAAISLTKAKLKLAFLKVDVYEDEQGK